MVGLLPTGDKHVSRNVRTTSGKGKGQAVSGTDVENTLSGSLGVNIVDQSIAGLGLQDLQGWNKVTCERITQKVLSNLPQDNKISNSMYYVACRCTNEITRPNSTYVFEIASKTMHTEELAAAKPPPTLLYASTLMRFRKITLGGTFNVLGNIR